MPTVLEVLHKTADFLARKGVPQPRLEAELLLAGALGCKRLDLFLRFERMLAEEELAPLRETVARRGRREPRQYIAGRAPFLDFELACDRRALIPRPETEELAELLFARFPAPPAAALDLGTGTGALACALARRWPTATIVAADARPETLGLARENAAALGLAERIEFAQTDWFNGLGGPARFNLMVSNPPYLTEREWEEAEPEVRDWEPRAALAAGADGLADLRTLLAGAPARLAPGGLLALETGIGQHAALAELAASARDESGAPAYARTEGLRDLHRRERFFLAWRA